MIGHSVERATGEEDVEAVRACSYLSHQIEKVVIDTPYTNLCRITFIMPPNANTIPTHLIW